MRASEPDTEAPEEAVEPRAARGGAEGPLRRARRRRSRRPRVAPVVVPRWIQLVMLPLALLGLCAVARAAGPGAAALHRRRADRAAAQPVRRRCCGAPASRAASAVATVYLVLVLALDRARRAARQPGRQPGLVLPATTCRAIVDDANALARRPPGLARPQRHRRPGHRARARPRCETLGDQVARGLGRPRRASRATRCCGSSRRSIALILILVLSVYMLLYGERIGAVVRRDRAARRRHAGGRLPDAHPGRRVRLRARPAAVLADHGHERGRLPVDLRVARDLPRRQDLRAFFGAFYGFAELIPYIGPVVGALPAGARRAVRPGPARRAVADDRVHRAAADRGPHRRAATSSATRCASTRCS